ncbi:zinc dependent phospholipase C family protein [Pseudopedobacter sp.]|uniref:zinc dependent phospholipase C family protein n=1 Tax=Pseudopedobacter sp. TaxID=1936787 RepID=UPI003342D38B
MKYFIKVFALLSCMILLTSWGFYAHKRIARLAVFTLPSEMIGFYKSNINIITENAVNPDKRRYVDSLEAHKHYLDADHFGSSPFDSIPEKWKDAVNKYSEDTLKAFGTVPWAIEKTYYRLIKAFENRDSSAIIKISADLSHYIADAHVPLHVTENYNGQLTGQLGIHSFWESRLPELYSGSYDYFVGKAYFIDHPLTEAWKIVKNTFSLVDSTLAIERRVNKSFPPDRKYSYSERNGKVIKQYSEEYARTYHDALSGMVENQMRKAILATGCFWYSAWVEAGQPDLKNISRGINLQEIKVTEPEDQLYQEGKVIGREDI